MNSTTLGAPSAMWQIVLTVIGIMVAIAVIGVVIESKKRDNFRAYWWGRLSAWAAANADAAHQRKSRHAMYHAVWTERAEHDDGELEAWGASAPRVIVMRESTRDALKSQAME